MPRIALASLALTLLAGTAPAPTLTARIEKETIDYGAPVNVVVAFENRSEETIRYHEPEHARSITFPSLRFVNVETGDAWIPYTAPIQRKVTHGNAVLPQMRGKIIEMFPGERKVYRIVRDRFGPVDRVLGKTDGKDKVPLPPGTYRVEAVYERTHDRVTFRTKSRLVLEEWRMPGLFVGKVEAKPVTFTVRRPDRPRVSIAPDNQGKAAVWLTFDNPTVEEKTFAGWPSLLVSSKMYGSGQASPAVVRDGDRQKHETIRIVVPAGEKKQFRVRLRALGFDVGPGPRCGLGELVPQGLVRVRFSMIDPRISQPQPGVHSFRTDGIFVRIPRPENDGIDGISVKVKAPEEAEAGPPVELEVEIANGGKEDVLLLHRLAFPRDVVIRIEDAAGKRPTVGSVTHTAGGIDALRPVGEGASRIAEGLSWNGDVFEKVPGLTRKDFVAIEPGDGIAKTFDLGRLLAKGFTPGKYRIRVGYRNYESGERLGFTKKHRAPVGIAWSEPVNLTVR